MTIALAALILLLCLIIGAGIGFLFGYRQGRNTGRHDTVRHLILAKDQECWVAAHYLEADTVAEAETQRLTRREVRGKKAGP